MAFLVGELLTAARMNEEIRSILEDFGAVATIGTTQSTSSISYVDLATVGPSLTLTSTGTLALCFISCTSFHNTDATILASMGVAVSGATTIAASTSAALVQNGATGSTGGGLGIQSGILIPFTITPGVNTYTAKYRSGTATQSNFSNRKMTVWAP